MDYQEYYSTLQIVSRFLKTKDRSSNEVRSFLRSKKLPEKKIAETIQEMQENGVLDDRRFVKNSIFSYLQDFRGKLYIVQKFDEKEISKEFYTPFLEEISKEEFLEKCKEFVSKKWGKNLQKESAIKIFSCIKTLYSRGYELETIRSALRDFGINSEILENLDSL